MQDLIVGHDKYGEKYSAVAVTQLCKNMVSSNNYFHRKAKKMSADFDKATELVDEATRRFEIAIQRLVSSEKKATENAKQVSGKVRDSAQKLSDGLMRIEKQANFDRLERYVELLERADKALNSLAELEKSGKLEKIAAAVR